MAVAATAQPPIPGAVAGGIVFVKVDPSGTCTNPNSPMQYNYVNGKEWGCQAGTWTQVSGGGGGGATIAHTLNVIKGDNAGNGISAGFAATGAGIVGLFSGCSGTQYLGADGACHAAGTGTVTTFSGSGPSWLTWTVSNPTTTPAASLAPTTGQSSHQVIGTCGSATAFSPCALVAADLPTLSTTVNSTTCTIGSTCTVTAAPSGSAGGVLSGTFPNPGFASTAADTVIMNATGSTAAPTAVTMPTCTTGAVLYNTSTHAWSCVSTGGGGGGGLVLVEQHTASSSASLDFTTCISSTYDEYQIDLLNVLPATNNVDLQMRMSTDGGMTYDTSTIYDNNFLVWLSNTTAVSTTSGATANIVQQSASNSSAFGLSMKLTFASPASSSANKAVYGSGTGADASSGTRLIGWSVANFYESLSSVNAFQFRVTSGNIASGTIRCYGLAK